MTNYETLSQIRFLPELQNANIHEKANILQNFIQSVIFDHSGLCYSLLLIDGERSVRMMTPEDIQSIDIWDDFHQDELSVLLKQEAYTFENSLTTAGAYLRSQALRYKVTGEAEALSESMRAFNSIYLVYRWGVAKSKPGWLGKPYGRKFSLASTPDQYFFALLGMREFYDIAPAPEREKVERMVVDIADFSIERNYQLTLTETPWVMAEELYGYNAIYMLINILAYEISGEEKYTREFSRLAQFGRWREETYLDHWRDLGLKRMLQFERMSLPYFAVASAEWIYELAPYVFGKRSSLARDKWEECLGRWYRFSKLGMDDEYYVHYWVDIDVEKGTWTPTGLTPVRPPEEADTAPTEALFMRYYSDVAFSPNMYRQLLIAVYAAQYCHGQIQSAAYQQTLDMMKLTDGTRLRWFIDRDGKQLLPELKWMGCIMDSEAPFHYLTAYWLGRKAGWW